MRLVSDLATATDMMAGVTISNVTGRNVTKVSIGLIVTIPQQCNARSFVSRERVHSFDVTLAPGESTTLSNLHLSTVGLRRLIARLHAQDVLSQIAIVGVTYNDGTSWHLTRSTRVYDARMMKKEIALRCGTVQGKSFTADGSLPCKGHLVMAKQGGYNGQYYTCVAGVGEICSVSPTNNASCTNTACPDKTSCSDQKCQLSAPPPDPPNPPDSSTCDDSDYWSGCDDGSGDGGDGVNLDDPS